MTGARRGVALVVVLWTVVMLATATALASRAARASAAVTATARAQVIARTMAENGVLALRQQVEDSLSTYVRDPERRTTALERLVAAGLTGTPLVQDTLGTGVFAVTLVDVSARLDVNQAGVDGLRALLGTVMPPGEAAGMSARVDEALQRRVPMDADRRSRDSVAASLLGRAEGVRRAYQLESLDALLDVPGVARQPLLTIAPLLTVDGDGRINRRGAPAAVRTAASGTLVDGPVRLLLIARGWEIGHPLTREIEAVFDVADDGLRLVRWRERDR